jgi:hypothetical protein
MSEAGNATFNSGATFGGNVGIGVSPQVELHIKDTGGLSRIRLEGTASGADNFEFGQGTTGVSNSGFEIYDIDATASRFVIDSSGNVGIGESSPARGLSIHKEGNHLQLTTNTSGTAAGNGTDLKVDASSSEFQLLNYESAGIAFFTSGAQKVTIDSSGQVGIGTSSPDADLHLGAASPHIDIGPSGGNRGKVGFDSNNVYIGSTSGTGEIYFKNNIGSTDAPHSSGDTKMVITDDGVGIGTSSPSNRLHALLDSSTTNDTVDVVRIEATSSGTPAVGFGPTIRFQGERAGASSDMMGRIGFVADNMTSSRIDGAFVVETGIDGSPTERMRIDSGGRIGIGVTPETTSNGKSLTINRTVINDDDAGSFHISQNSYYNSAWKYVENGTAEKITFGTGVITFDRAASNSSGADASLSWSESMRIDSGGRVGIGKTPASSTGSMLQIEGADGIAMRRSGQTNHFVLRPLSSSDGDGIRFTQEGVGDRMFIDSSGNVLVGATSNNSANAGHGFQPDGFVYHTRDGGAMLRLNRLTSDGAIQQFQKDGSTVGSIDVSGSATSYNTSSDHRLKENVMYDWDATTRLKQLKPARFNFIVDPDTTVDGFLAHEAQAVVPEAITGTKDEVDDDGNAVMQGIDQSKLVPLLVKTIQELEARIAALEAG